MLKKLLILLLITSPALGQQYDSGGNLKVGMYRWNNVAVSAALALADNTANPTAPPIGAYNLIWDGATWDRWTGSVSATNLDIRDLVAATDSVSIHGDVGLLSQFDLTSSDPATVAIVDGNGDQITSFGGGTQYTEDAAAAANPVGTAVNLIRQDTPGALVTTDGDNVAQRGTNFGAGFVQVLTSAGAFVDTFGGGTQYNQGTATTDTDTLTMSGAVRRDTAAVATGVIDGDRLALSTDSAGRLRVSSIDVTQPISGTVTVTDGSGALNVIVDSGTITAVTDITNPVTVTDGAGALNTIIDSGTVTTVSTVTSVTQNADVRQTTASNLNAQVVGSVASDAADSGNPVKTGGIAVSYGTGITAVAAADRVNSVYSRDGVQWVINGSPNSTAVEYLWTTAQTNDALVTVATGTRIVVTGYQMTLDEATTVGVGIRCGFATATLSTPPTDGNTATGIFLTHLGVVPGGGLNNPPGMIMAGADDEDLRCTTEATTSGTGKLVVFYFTTAN